MSTKDFVIRAAPESLDGIVAMRRVAVDRRQWTLVKRADGAVFNFGVRSINLAESWVANDKLRRAACALTGWRFADVKAAQRAETAARNKREAAQAVSRLKHQATRAGYRLVKIRSAQ